MIIFLLNFYQKEPRLHMQTVSKWKVTKQNVQSKIRIFL